MSVDIVKLVIAVTSYCHIDNYDAHIKLRIASKAYRICTENINTNVIFNVTVEEQNKSSYHTKTIHKVCGVVHDLYKPAIIVYYRNTRLYEFYYNGELHRERTLASDSSCPARIEKYDNGIMILEEYYINGKRHRAGTTCCSMPAHEHYRPNEHTYMSTMPIYDRDNSPILALDYAHDRNLFNIVLYEWGCHAKGYYINGKLHREDGPALIHCSNVDDSGQIAYFINGECHKENGPAVIVYNNIKTEERIVRRKDYYIHSKLHRVDGPAIIYYDFYGSIEKEIYYIDGQQISYEQFMVITSC